MARTGIASAAACALALGVSVPAAAQPSFVAFESGPVRPLALAPSGDTLFAVNTPDGYLEIFDIDAAGGLAHRASVPVGMEPVAVAARSDDEVWVVNHLSDSVSIVDVPSARVVRTLLVGDEPRDIVFAGQGGSRAFITTAHRGQHRTHPSLTGVPGAGDPELTTPGVGRADVWVFDAGDLGDEAFGIPVEIAVLFGDTPRALAVSPDGGTVYAGIFHSGNRSAVVPEGAVCNGFDAAGTCQRDGATMPGGLPGPSTNADGEQAPETGLIIQYDPQQDAWLDDEGRDWSGAIRFDLPDFDVFALDADTLEEASSPVPHVGTTIFNLAVNPVTGTVYATNTEARNRVRFEGPGEFADSTVQGRLAEARITVIENGEAIPRHLNSHIDYSVTPAPAGTAEHSLSTPLEMAITSDGATLFVAAFGSSRVGVVPTASLEDGSFDPEAASADYIAISGGGPAGLALDEASGRLYVLTRFDNSIAVVDVDAGEEIAKTSMHSPEPARVVDGRRFLYDARATSSNGEASCASCHIFGDTDHLAWDLGDPDAPVTQSPIPIQLREAAGGSINGTGNAEDFHPMKGPMTTQTLRGMQNHGAMHWRGDRATGFYGTAAFDEDLAFRNFIVAFVGLVGRDEHVSDADMQAFADFALELVMPPNPVRDLDNSLTASQQRGRDFFVGPRLSDGVDIPGFGFPCEGCHRLSPEQGFYGTDGRQSFENEPQIIKIAQLRNLYTKVGMFGMLDVSFLNSGDNDPKGPQVRGTGFLHDGSIDTLFRFFQATVFNPNGDIGFTGGDAERRDMEAFMLAFPSELAPIVGQQVTLPGDAAAEARVDLLLERAQAPFVSAILGGEVTECDLIAKVPADDRVRGYVLRTDGAFEPDDDSGSISADELRDLAGPGSEVTFTCVPPGSGERMGVDRDGDGIFDGLDDCPDCGDDDDDGDDGDPGADAGPGPGPDAGGPGVDDPEGGSGGCGCRAGTSPPASSILLVLAVAALTRRRSTARS